MQQAQVEPWSTYKVEVRCIQRQYKEEETTGRKIKREIALLNMAALRKEI